MTLPVSVPVIMFVIKLSITTKATTPITTVTNPLTDNSHSPPYRSEPPSYILNIAQVPRVCLDENVSIFLGSAYTFDTLTL